MKRTFKMLVIALLSIAMVSCASTSPSAVRAKQTTERNHLYGVGEPITMVLGSRDSVDIALNKMETVGFTAMREWMHITNILADPATPKPGAVAMYSKTLDKLKSMKVEITGMSHLWYLAGNPITPCNNAMYARDLTPGSLYMQTLEMLQTSWRTMAKSFPQVTQWEVGNEWNTDDFLHPVGWSAGKKGFTAEEKCKIAVDMMYYAYKGIKEGNPDAVVVSYSPTVDGYLVKQRKSPLYGIMNALEMMYAQITKGDPVGGSHNPDDYFDMLAWHPYVLYQMSPVTLKKRGMPSEIIDEAWKAANDSAYHVMNKYGDADKKVLFTEMGFNDEGDAAIEAAQVRMLQQMFDLVKTMPYVKTIHVFRLIMGAGQTGDNERWFGIFKGADENFAPREKARVMQRLCGGTKSLK
jgi:hypothetical protein